MKKTAPEKHFLQFRDRGDVDALGEVFDWAAPELMRTGAWLTRDSLAAEDLLQSTFLTAIERCDSYDAGRPLMPWLVGILANHARRWRGRPVTGPLPGEDPPARSSDPAMELGIAELGEALTEELDRLESSEREVLLLSILHDFEPAQIAVALDRSPSTVRTQLRRGRRRLRERLPRSLALPAGIPAGGELDMIRTAVRGRVLDQAGGIASVGVRVSASTAVGGATVPGMLGIVVASVVAGAIGLLFWIQSQDVENWEDVQPTGVVALSPIADALLRPPSDVEASTRMAPSTDPGPEIRRSSAPEATPEAEERPNEASFEAIVVDTSGDPIANASIELTSVGVRGDWKAPGETGSVRQTDAKGRAIFSFPREKDDGTFVDGLSFEIWCQGYGVHKTGPVNTIPEVQRFVLRPACTLIVTAFIDSPHQLVPIEPPRISPSAGLAERDGAWQVMGEGLGSNQILPGNHELLVVHQGRDGVRYFSDPVTIDATLGKVVELRLQLRPGRTVCGEVDASVPRPIRDGLVNVHLVNPLPRSGRGRDGRHPDRVHFESSTPIRSDGTFCFGPGNGLPALPGEVDAACDGWVASLATGHVRNAALESAHAVLLDHRMILASDATDVRISMQPCGNLSLIAMDPGGERVPGVEFTTPPRPGAGEVCSIPRQRSLKATTGTDGTVHFSGIAPGWAAFKVDHPTLRLPLEKGAGRLYYRRKTVRVEPDQSLIVEIQLEEK